MSRAWLLGSVSIYAIVVAHSAPRHLPHKHVLTRNPAPNRIAYSKIHVEAQMKHSLERTSPKGPGQKFIGYCRLCGQQNLPGSAVFEDCENPRGLTADEAVIDAILPDEMPVPAVPPRRVG
jgi:hypothetical protein